MTCLTSVNFCEGQPSSWPNSSLCDPHQYKTNDDCPSELTSDTLRVAIDIAKRYHDVLIRWPDGREMAFMRLIPVPAIMS